MFQLFPGLIRKQSDVLACADLVERIAEPTQGLTHEYFVLITQVFILRELNEHADRSPEDFADIASPRPLHAARMIHHPRHSHRRTMSHSSCLIRAHAHRIVVHEKLPGIAAMFRRCLRHPMLAILVFLENLLRRSSLHLLLQTLECV